jgi:hypothetical protein
MFSFLVTFHFWDSDIFVYQKSEINLTGGDSIAKMFSLVCDDSKKMPTKISISNICFSLDHLKVHVDGSSCEFTSKFWFMLNYFKISLFSRIYS